MKIVVYDLETKEVPGQNGIGWNDKHKLGISVGVAYDYSTNDTHVFLDDNLKGLVDLLNSADLVCAFNHIGFDNPLLRAEAKNQGITAGLREDSELKLYDMLVESRRGAGVNDFTKGFKLDQHLKAIFGEAQLKTGDGAMAPVLHKEGKIGELISYCIADVRRERLLFEYIWYRGTLKTEGRPTPYPVRRPQEVMGLPLDTRLPYTLFPTTDKAFKNILENFKELPSKEPAAK